MLCYYFPRRIYYGEWRKKSKTGLHVFVGILLGIIFCGGVVFVFYTLGYITFGTIEEIDNSNEKNNDSNTNNNENFTSNLGFDQAKIINHDENNYILSREFDGIVASLDDTRTKVTIKFSRNITGGFDSFLPDGDSDEYFNDSKEIKFSKKIKDIYIGGFCVDFSNDTLLFLTEDGTVEYLPVGNNLQTDPDNFKSYGVLDQLTDIILFYDAEKESYGNTILAQKSDGTIYDLQPILKATGNYFGL